MSKDVFYIRPVLESTSAHYLSKITCFWCPLEQRSLRSQIVGSTSITQQIQLPYDYWVFRPIVITGCNKWSIGTTAEKEKKKKKKQKTNKQQKNVNQQQQPTGNDNFDKDSEIKNNHSIWRRGSNSDWTQNDNNNYINALPTQSGTSLLSHDVPTLNTHVNVALFGSQAIVQYLVLPK